jgi:hypothetical protein
MAAVSGNMTRRAGADLRAAEEIGGVRNWDYRYTWVRDAAFTNYAFLRLGLTSEAEQFMAWLERLAGQVILFAAPILHLLHQLSPNASGRAIATMKLGFRRLRR